MLAVFGIEDILDRDNHLVLKLPYRKCQLNTHIIDDIPVGCLFKFGKPVLPI